jgi:branched-chain amino acid transport system ATP-binding protein
MSEKVLEIRNVTLRFGGVVAVSDVSFDVRRGEMVGLIGPNGAGKTSLLKTIVGANRQNAGSVLLDGTDISGMKTARRCGMGLAMSHQIVRPLRNMNLLDNVALAAGKSITGAPLTSLFHFSRKPQRARALEILDLVQIRELAGRDASGQPLGVLKRLEVARALALSPHILLLDEPLAGLGHGEMRPISDLLQKLNRQGVTILLVEHNIAEARRICSRFVVLDNGHKIADGPADEVMKDRRVVEAYIGGDGGDA